MFAVQIQCSFFARGLEPILSHWLYESYQVLQDSVTQGLVLPENIWYNRGDVLGTSDEPTVNQKIIKGETAK